MRCYRSSLTAARTIAAGVVFLIIALSLGCGSEATDSSQSAGSQAAQTEDFELDVARCAGFGASEAAAILGVPAESFEDDSQDLSEDSRWCILANATDPEMGVTFTVSRADSVEQAALEFEQFRGNVGVAVGTIGEEGETAHDVPDLGDEALWTPVPGGVYLRKGRYSVQVNQPSEEATQIKIARKILGE